MRPEIVTETTPELVDAVARLLPQLTTSKPAPTFEEVDEIVRGGATDLFVVRDGSGGAIVGVSTLALFRIPSGVRAWIEDVIVDDAARGKGIGELLTRAMIDRARERGALTVELTSRPSREAANRLYQRVGFERRETNLYRYELK
jgi:ribosomal protein S18 acetylase RimI-like enzyme